MLKDAETEETIVFFVAFLSLEHFYWGGGGLPPGYAYGTWIIIWMVSQQNS